MSRVKIVKEYHEDKASFWRSWLEKKEINHHLGYRVSKELRTIICEKMVKLEDENERLKRQNIDMAEIQNLITELKLRPDDILWRNDKKEYLSSLLVEAAGGLPNGFQSVLQNAINVLQNLQRAVDGRRPGKGER